MLLSSIYAHWEPPCQSEFILEFLQISLNLFFICAQIHGVSANDDQDNLTPLIEGCIVPRAIFSEQLFLADAAVIPLSPWRVGVYLYWQEAKPRHIQWQCSIV